MVYITEKEQRKPRTSIQDDIMGLTGCNVEIQFEFGLPKEDGTFKIVTERGRIEVSDGWAYLYNGKQMRRCFNLKQLNRHGHTVNYIKEI